MRNAGSTFYLYFVYAVSFTLVGPIMKDMMSEYGLSMQRAGLLVNVQNLAGLGAIVYCAFFGDGMPKSRLLVVSTFLYSASMFFMFFKPAYPWFMILFFLLGIGTRIIATISNAYISDFYMENRQRYLNRLHGYFAVGAFLGPFMMSVIQRLEADWSLIFLILSGLSCTGLVFFVLSDGRNREAIPEPRENMTMEQHTGGVKNDARVMMRKMLSSGNQWILNLTMALYMGELCVLITWLPFFQCEIAGSRGWFSNTSLLVYWIGVFISRMWLAKKSDRFGSIRMVAVGNLISGCLLVSAFITGSSAVLIPVCLCVGICTGFSIPFTISVSCAMSPRHTSMASAFLYIWGFLGQIMFTSLAGFVGEKLGIRSAMIMSAGALPLITLTLLGLVKRENRMGKKAYVL